MNTKEERKSDFWDDDLNNIYLDLSVLELAIRWSNFRSKNDIIVDNDDNDPRSNNDSIYESSSAIHVATNIHHFGEDIIDEGCNDNDIHDLSYQ